eukprot:g3291.t1
MSDAKFVRNELHGERDRSALKAHLNGNFRSSFTDRCQQVKTLLPHFLPSEKGDNNSKKSIEDLELWGTFAAKLYSLVVTQRFLELGGGETTLGPDPTTTNTDNRNKAIGKSRAGSGGLSELEIKFQKRQQKETKTTDDTFLDLLIRESKNEVSKIRAEKKKKNQANRKSKLRKRMRDAPLTLSPGDRIEAFQRLHEAVQQLAKTFDDLKKASAVNPKISVVLLPSFKILFIANKIYTIVFGPLSERVARSLARTAVIAKAKGYHKHSKILAQIALEIGEPFHHRMLQDEDNLQTTQMKEQEEREREREERERETKRYREKENLRKRNLERKLRREEKQSLFLQYQRQHRDRMRYHLLQQQPQGRLAGHGFVRTASAVSLHDRRKEGDIMKTNTEELTSSNESEHTNANLALNSSSPLGKLRSPITNLSSQQASNLRKQLDKSNRKDGKGGGSSSLALSSFSGPNETMMTKKERERVEIQSELKQEYRQIEDIVSKSTKGAVSFSTFVEDLLKKSVDGETVSSSGGTNVGSSFSNKFPGGRLAGRGAGGDRHRNQSRTLNDVLLPLPSQILKIRCFLSPWKPSKANRIVWSQSISEYARKHGLENKSQMQKTQSQQSEVEIQLEFSVAKKLGEQMKAILTESQQNSGTIAAGVRDNSDNGLLSWLHLDNFQEMRIDSSPDLMTSSSLEATNGNNNSFVKDSNKNQKKGKKHGNLKPKLISQRVVDIANAMSEVHVLRNLINAKVYMEDDVYSNSIVLPSSQTDLRSLPLLLEEYVHNAGARNLSTLRLIKSRSVLSRLEEKFRSVYEFYQFILLERSLWRSKAEKEKQNYKTLLKELEDEKKNRALQREQTRPRVGSRAPRQLRKLNAKRAKLNVSSLPVGFLYLKKPSAWVTSWPKRYFSIVKSSVRSPRHGKNAARGRYGFDEKGAKVISEEHQYQDDEDEYEVDYEIRWHTSRLAMSEGKVDGNFFARHITNVHKVESHESQFQFEILVSIPTDMLENDKRRGGKLMSYKKPGGSTSRGIKSLNYSHHIPHLSTTTSTSLETTTVSETSNSIGAGGVAAGAGSASAENGKIIEKNTTDCLFELRAPTKPEMEAWLGALSFLKEIWDDDDDVNEDEDNQEEDK